MNEHKRRCSIFQFLSLRSILLLLTAGMFFFLIASSKFSSLRIVPVNVKPKSESSTIKIHYPEKSVVTESRIREKQLSQTLNLAVDHRRRLAETITSVQRELETLAGTRAIIDAKWPLKLAAVAAELDPRISLRTNSSVWDLSARLPSMGPGPPLVNKARHVCPEIYDVNKRSAFYTTNMRPEQCTYVPELKNVITALLPAYEWEPGTANFVVNQIRKYYDIPVIVIVSSGTEILENITDVSVIKPNKSENMLENINKAIKLINTPYVFMGLNMTHFDKHSSLERLVRILDELDNIKVVGAAARDHQGHWIHGCLQLRLAYYQAYYASGYYYSKFECMYCDDLLTPFVTSKKMLEDIPLTTVLYGPALYRDWFLKVREAGHLVMSCPDVLFYIHKHAILNEDDWLMVGQRWELQKITSYDKNVYSFPCAVVGLSCDKVWDRIRSYLLPPCCAALMEQYTTALLEWGPT